MTSHAPRRIVYVAFALGTIALGLWVHRSDGALGIMARDVLGDALWAAMMMWWVSALLPRLALLARGAVTFAICAAVEVSQLVHTPALDALRRTTLGQLVLGSGFDPRDFAAYALGVGVAIVIDRITIHRTSWSS